MKCAGCGHEYPAKNQSDPCPKCGAASGTPAEREEDWQSEHAEKVRWFEQYEDATQAARDVAHQCRDYYDGDQWSTEEKAKLAARNQAPVVVNRMAKKINYLGGLEIQGRSDPHAYPRTPIHEDDAQAVTDSLRYVVDSEDFDKTASEHWEEKLVEGAGGAIVEVEPDSADLEIKIRRVEFDRFFYDPHSRERDFSDAKFLGLSTWMDLEDAIAYFERRSDRVENFRDVLESSMLSTADGEAHPDKPTTAWSDADRKRVRWTETYYRRRGIWHVCFAAKAGFLVLPHATGYLDERGNDTCPLVVDSAFVARDGSRYGLAKHMLSIQDEINHSRSKALYWQAVDRTIAEEGAVINPDEARTERAKPNSWLTVAPGALVEGRVRFEDGSGKASQQLQRQGLANNEIDMVGPDAPQIGTMAGAASGRALMMRQQIGNLEIAKLVDGHSRWKRAVYRQIWYRVRQFWKDEKWLRVRDDAERETGYRFVKINRSITRAQRLAELMDKPVKDGSAPMSLEGALSVAVGRHWQVFLQKVQSDVQQLLQRQTQILAQQAQATGQPAPPPPQLPPEQLQVMLRQAVEQHPLMTEPVIVNDVAQLSMDVLLDESPDTAILQLEEYESYMQVLPTLIGQDPQNAKLYLAIGLEMSGSRYKRRVLQMLQQPTQADPQQAQAAQVAQQAQQAMAQANVASMQARAQRDQAAAAKAAAEMQLMPAQAQAEAQATMASAQRDAAQAAHAAAQTQVALPAQARLDMARTAQITGEAMATQMLAPAEAHKAHAQARKAEAETTTNVVVAIPTMPRGVLP